jgi:hypothetical protein
MVALQQLHGNARRKGVGRKEVGASVCIRTPLQNECRHVSGGQVEIPFGFPFSFRAMEGKAQANDGRGAGPTC